MGRLTRRELANLPTGAETPIDYAVSHRDAGILDMVRDAVTHNHAMLAFQPVVRSTATNSIAFHEGLIRVLDATGRVIPAGDFMHVVENNELGREIDVLALKFGCRALAQVPDLRLSINLSARSIGYKPYIRVMERWLAKDPTIGPRLILEITETSAIMVPELVVDFMDRLQMHGVCFALDDFGAGYTALRYFKDFFFDIVKIDGQFIRNISQDADNQMLTSVMASIAKQFDMLCIAEKVETQEDVQILQQIGVDCLQGYYFGAPTTTPAWLPVPKKRQLI